MQLLKIGILLPNYQRQHRTLHIQRDVMPHPEGCAALCIVLVTMPHVGRACEHFPDGFEFQLLHATVTFLDYQEKKQRLRRF
jgi:hypothetical protein